MTGRTDGRPDLEVFVNEAGGVTIRTRTTGGDAVVALQPGQVPSVIRWLQECLDLIDARFPPASDADG